MNQTFQDGVNAFKAGNLDEARKIFIATVKAEPNNENAWGWLYQVAKNDNEKIECLKKMLTINPGNKKAKELLDDLLAPPFMMATSPTNPTPQRPVAHPPDANANKLSETPKQQKNLLIGIGSFILVCFICICAFSLYNPPAGPKDYKTMSYYICQLYVENSLKAPSTADFAPSLDANIRDLGNNTFEISSYVDAQNSFGAVIRTDFYCKLQYTGTSEDDEAQSKYWQLLDFNIAE